MNNKHLITFIILFLNIIEWSIAQNLTGFSSIRHQEEQKIEALFLKLPESENFKNHLRQLTLEPHLAGTPENKRVADYIEQSMARAGFKVERPPYDIYLPTGPGEVELELVTPIRMPLNIKEFILENDSFSANPKNNHGWNSYSGNGDRTAQIVYANYGTKEDFERLESLGISVKGKIVIARYGGNFRGYKAKYAQAAGAVGLIIYPDPEDSGYMRGLVYPEGKMFNESTIQRGSVLTLDYTGDPLTPFEPALPLDAAQKVERLKPEDVKGFHTIPVTPIGYGAAKEILSRMTGQPVPENWQGGLPFTYRLEGGEKLTMRLKVNQPKGFVRVENVIGTLEGSEYPDEWIILGSHYDAWEFGATDPNSGTAMLLTLADALGELAKQGIRPRRTIKIAHWDAEEHGILGSTEWVEQFRDELDQKGVAYFNADGACSGLSFNGAAAPSLKSLLVDATKVVPYPKSDKTVYDHWLERASNKAEGPGIGNLGGGSDHLGFYAHVGIPSLSAGMGGPTMYHSVYDNFHWYETVGEPDFVAGPTVAKVMGVMALRMANADILPFDVARYGKDLKTHLASAEKQIQGYSATYSAKAMLAEADILLKNGAAYQQVLLQKLNSKGLNKNVLQGVNQKLLKLERAFIDAKGMAYGAWYRSLYASSDPYSGYASWMLPGLLYEASLKSTQNLPDLEKRYIDAMKRLNNSIMELSSTLKNIK
ncbi:MAG: M28 family peptidase [Saprospiraceae bacterium]|nr:M28 family peptidase [Saprospiraceae bacterium]